MKRGRLVIVKCLIVICIIFHSISAFAASECSLDKLKWYECVDVHDCSLKSTELKTRLKNGRGSKYDFHEYLIVVLLTEVLKQGQEPLNMTVINEIDLLKDSVECDTIKHILDVFKKSIFQQNEDFEGHYSDELSFQIAEVFSYRNDFQKYHSSVKKILDKQFIPFLALNLSEKLVAKGDLELAENYLDKLVKDYSRDVEVVAMWAKTKMDLGKYDSNIEKKLLKFQKNNDLSVASLLVRYYSNHSKEYKVANIVASVGRTNIKGKEGSQYLLELAKYRLKQGKRLDAEVLLNDAMVLEPENSEIYLEMGKLYLSENKQIDKAVAMLYSYVALSNNHLEKEKIKLLLDRID